MKELSLEQIKEIELNILIEIDRICSETGIRYSLAGGSMLGAVRHNGFIPWDDDIDIIMMRYDYKKLIDYCREHPELPFNVICHETSKEYNKGATKVVDNSTVLVSEIDNDASLGGVFIDIFPVDYLGDDYESAVKAFNKSKFLRELLVARQWKKYKRSKTHSIIYEPIRLALYILSRFTNGNKLLNRIESKYNTEIKKYSGCIYGVYRKREVMETEIFENLTTHIFEGKEFSIFKDYDRYLSSIYGDYMKLPPENKRVTHHDYRAYYKD